MMHVEIEEFEFSRRGGLVVTAGAACGMCWRYSCYRGRSARVYLQPLRSCVGGELCRLIAPVRQSVAVAPGGGVDCVDDD